MGPTGPSAVFGMFFSVIWFVMMAGMVISWIVLLVAIWRAMKAHESIATSARFMLDEMSTRNERMARSDDR